MNENIKDFLTRFYSFYDSVIREVKISYNSKKGTRIKIIISVRDENMVSNEGWVNVNLEISGVKEYVFQEGINESYQVLSNGLHILHLEGLIFFDFGFHTEEPESINELKESKYYVVGKDFLWTVEDYQEFLE